MENYEEKFPRLYQFLGVLFHQDWAYVFDWQGRKPNYEGVVRDARIRENKSLMQENARELQDFLNSGLSDAEIENVMRREFDLGIRPAYWNLNHREWLEHVLEILEEPIEKTRNEFIPEFTGWQHKIVNRKFADSTG